MEKMDTTQMATALIGAVLAFRQKWDADLEVQQADRALMTEEQQEASANEIQPAEMPEEEWWDHFVDYIQHEGLSRFANPDNPDVACFAALKQGEPSFTLRGQDKFASVLVKHWIVLAEAFADDIRARKLDQADRIAAAMEEFTPQKFPD